MSIKAFIGMSLLGLFLVVGPAKGFFGLAIRVGCAYATYKFVDGVSDGTVSDFIDKYKAGPVDAISAFGKGIKKLGSGTRSVTVSFWNDKRDDSLTHAWEQFKTECNNAIQCAQDEWTQRKVAYAKKGMKISELENNPVADAKKPDVKSEPKKLRDAKPKTV